MIAVPVNPYRPFFGLLSRHIGGYRVACGVGRNQCSVRVSSRQLAQLKPDFLAAFSRAQWVGEGI